MSQIEVSGQARPRPLGDLRAVAVGTIATATFVGFLAYPKEADDAIPVWAITIVAALAAAIVLGVVVPRALRRRAAGRRTFAALALGALAVLSVVLYGVGLSFVLGAGAIAVARGEGGAAPGGQAGVALAILGAGASAAMAVAYYVTGPW